ncbi:MAG: hypothetical protein ACP5N2_00975 [Candidatus Nanoarchaeia archaeon]
MNSTKVTIFMLLLFVLSVSVSALEDNKISYWCGKVNQHQSDGEWYTDNDRVSGCDIDKLTYCKKFWPSTVSVIEDGEETIGSWMTQNNAEGPFDSTKMTYACVQETVNEECVFENGACCTGDTCATSAVLCASGTTPRVTGCDANCVPKVTCETNNKCKDSDGGIKYNIAGETSVYIDGYWYAQPDGTDTYAEGYWHTQPDNCNTISNALSEYSCAGKKDGNIQGVPYMNSNTIMCNSVYGTGSVCKDGACTTPTQSADHKIAYWYGKVNVHLENGVWTTDLDGVSGADIDKLAYCKKFWPKTTIVTESREETINVWRNRGNIDGPFTSKKMTYNCIEEQSVPREIVEEVKCIFNNADVEHKCYSEKGSCAGKGTCVIEIRGKSEEKVAWKSSCGGYAYTTLDGKNEHAIFDCKGTPQRENTPCLDSDRGFNYFEEGSATYSFNGQTYAFSDKCIDNIDGASYTTAVEEAYCSGEYSVGTIVHTCVAGCSNGACIKEKPIVKEELVCCKVAAVTNRPITKYMLTAKSECSTCITEPSGMTVCKDGANMEIVPVSFCASGTISVDGETTRGEIESEKKDEIESEKKVDSTVVSNPSGIDRVVYAPEQENEAPIQEIAKERLNEERYRTGARGIEQTAEAQNGEDISYESKENSDFVRRWWNSLFGVKTGGESTTIQTTSNE